MLIHSEIRDRVITDLQAVITDPAVHWFNGWIASLDEKRDIPAIVVYLESIEKMLGYDWPTYSAAFVVQVFVNPTDAVSADPVVDGYIEQVISAMGESYDCNNLAEFNVTGINYERDPAKPWRSARINFDCTYTIEG